MANAAGAAGRLTTHFLEVVANKVRQVRATQMTPKVFHRIQFGSVGRQVLHRQPRSLLPQIGLDFAAAMRRQPIPQQDRLSTPQMAFQGPQVIEHLRLPDRTGVESQTKSNATSRRSGYQTGDGRESLPIERRHQDRGLAPRSPGATHRRTLGKAAFVEENQQGVRVTRFFLICGQRCFSQRRIVVSSRSRARPSGRWQLQPNCPKSFHT